MEVYFVFDLEKGPAPLLYSFQIELGGRNLVNKCLCRLEDQRNPFGSPRRQITTIFDHVRYLFIRAESSICYDS